MDVPLRVLTLGCLLALLTDLLLHLVVLILTLGLADR